MATLATTQLVKLRRAISRSGIPIDAVKSEFNAALQAVEDWFDSPTVQSNLSSAIDDATSHDFTNAQKKQIVKFWLQDRFGRE